MIINNIPKYLIIKNNIINKIKENIFKAGEILPSEKELINQYNVSRITVRKALSELENENYIYKVQGKGAFVKDNKSNEDFLSLTSSTQDIITLGMTPSRKVVSSDIIFNNNILQEALNLNNKDQIFSLKRIYYANNEPINFIEAYLPYKYLPNIKEYDFSKISLYDVLENKYNIKITRTKRTVEAIVSDESISEFLSIAEDTPILLFKCITCAMINLKEVPIEVSKCFYRSDHFKFYINQIK